MLIPDKVDSVCMGNAGNAAKPLSAMNLNELITNIFPAEDVNNLKQNSCSSASSSSSSSAASPFVTGTSFYLNKKTTDEVWGEIIVDQECGNAVLTNPSSSINKRQLRNIKGGDATLEEFLLQSGFPSIGNNVTQGNPRPLSLMDPMMLEKQQPDWMKFQMEPCADEQKQQQQAWNKRNLPVPIDLHVDHDSEDRVSDIGQVFYAGYLDNRFLELPIPLQKAEATSSESHFGGERKRHCPDELMEKSKERRQKRMIKNRESAARSRAKKQAYTKQLEEDVEQLKEKNNFLRRQKEFQVRLFSNSPSEPKYQLRRTSSAEL